MLPKLWYQATIQGTATEKASLAAHAFGDALRISFQSSVNAK
jgi:hypothetical protein